jgi:CMP-N,N'-diacetyllegionaminic acid synthase
VSVLALIPARGGSRGVPRKNVREIAGRPVIAWTIEDAAGSARVQRTIVTTDDEEIAEVARLHGAEVPFLRPAALAQDDTPDRPVYDHALAWLSEHEGYVPDVVVWLRPTTPLREPDDIGRALDILEQSGAACVRSVCLAEYHPYWMSTLEEGRLVPFVRLEDEDRFLRRQLLPPVYRLNGVVDAVRCERVDPERLDLFGGDIAAYVMPEERSVDVDTEVDLALADLLLRRRLGLPAGR